MNLHITTRCNMSCAHCQQSATAMGNDMSMTTFCKVVDKFAEKVRTRNEQVRMGSGEATLHPDLFDMIDCLLQERLKISISTNGKIKDRALRLGAMAKQGLLEVSLSLDKWHEPIDPEVVLFFKEGLNRSVYNGVDDGSGRKGAHWRNPYDKNDKRRIGEVLVPVRDGRAVSLPESVLRTVQPKCAPQLTISSLGKIAICGGRFGCPSTYCCPPFGGEVAIWRTNFATGTIDDPVGKFDEVFEQPWNMRYGEQILQPQPSEAVMETLT